MLRNAWGRVRVTISAKIRRRGRVDWENLPPMEGGAPGVVFTQFGEEWVIDVLDGLAPGTQYIHWGTGAGVPAKASTDVSGAAAEARVAATRSQLAADKMRWVATLQCAGAGKTITNAGLFKDTVGAVAIIVGDHTSQPLNIGDQIQYTITLEMT